MTEQLLLGLLGLLQAGVSTCCELGLELLNTARRIDKLQLAGIKRMASIADVQAELRTSAAGGE